MTRFLHISLLIISLLFFNSGLKGQSRTELTLADCLKLAFKNNLSLKAAELSIEQAREKYREAQAQRLPQLSLTGTYTHIGEVTSFTIPMGNRERTFKFGTQNRYLLDARTQLALFTWGQIAGSINMAESGISLSKVQKQQKTLQITDQVLRAYFSQLLNREIIQLQRKNLKRAKKLHQLTGARYQAGGVPRMEILRSEVRVKTMETNFEEARGNLNNSHLFLARTMGLSDTSFQISGSLDFKPVIINEEFIIEKALLHRNELQLLNLQQQISQYQANIIQTQNRPRLQAFSGYNVQNGFDPTDPGRFVDNWNAGLQLSFLLFDGFATRHRVQQVRLQKEQLQLQAADLQKMIVMQVRQALITLRQAGDKYLSQQENMELARTALQVAETQYEQGIASSLDVLDAQQTLAQSELMSLQALFNHIMAKIDLSGNMEDYQWFGYSLE
ncbi:MAG: TolC family protein [Calditrichia bacterium]